MRIPRRSAAFGLTYMKSPPGAARRNGVGRASGSLVCSAHYADLSLSCQFIAMTVAARARVVDCCARRSAAGGALLLAYRPWYMLLLHH